MPRPLIPHRRERILDAAEALVLERGFDAMSVQEIATRVGIAKGALYREFRSKHEILGVLLQRGMRRLTDASRAILGDATPRLSTAYRVGVQVLLDDALMTAAFLDDEGVLGDYVASVPDRRYRARHLAVVGWIADLQRAGSLSTRIEAEALGLALSSTTLGLLTAARHLGPLSRDQLEAAIRAVEQLVTGLELPDLDNPSADAAGALDRS